MNHCRIAALASVAALVLALGLAPSALPARAATLPPSPGAPEASFDVGSLHVDKYGTGTDAVVLIPGLELGPWEWFGVIPHLAATKRVYVVTLPGFDGRAPSTAAPGTLLATTEADVAALIAREHLVRPIVVGHSLGGTTAIGFAEAYPLLARGVVSVDALPVALALAYQPEDELKRQADSAALNFAAIKTPAAIRQFMLQNAGTTGAVDSGTMDAVIQKELTADHTTAVNDLRELLETDLRPGLSKIAVPLEVMVPYYLPDNSTPPSIQPPIVFKKSQKVQNYRDALAGAKTVTVVPIEPARHFIMLDDPTDFMAALDAFLAAHPPQ